MEFRSCNVQDIEKIYELCKELIFNYEDLNSINLDFVLNWVERKITNSIESYSKIIVNKQHIGYIHILDQDEIEIDDFYIFDEFQNKGYGTQVLKNIIENNKKPIFLYVFSKNTRAISFYKKVGFEIDKDLNTRLIMKYTK